MDRHHSRAKFHRTFDSLRRFMRSDHPFGQPNCSLLFRISGGIAADQRFKLWGASVGLGPSRESISQTDHDSTR